MLCLGIGNTGQNGCNTGRVWYKSLGNDRYMHRACFASVTVCDLFVLHALPRNQFVTDVIDCQFGFWFLFFVGATTFKPFK